jgi:Mg-chelatase subunit ChlD
MVAISIEIAHIQLARTELRTATDAASKAAALELAQTQDINLAITRGMEIAAQNEVIGDPLLLSPSDFQFGSSLENNSTGRFDFSQSATPINGVRVTGSRTSGSRSGPIALFLGNVLGTAIFEPQAVATATFINRDVVLVVDRSGSMAGSLLQELRAALFLFTQTLAATPVDEHVGMASYEETATIDALLSPNLAEIDGATSRLRAAGLTSISRGMQAGQQVFQSGRSARFVERTMIVMTDGQHNRGPEPRTVATSLASQNVMIHTITFGPSADIRRMREVAAIGRGRHFHAASGPQLAEIYREIALSLGTLLTE